MDTEYKLKTDVAQYEGLVRKLAAEVSSISEEDFDDICQFLRVKVWKVIGAFDSTRVKTTSKYSPQEQLDRFVYACLQNAKKDVLKKKRRDTLFIEDVAPVKELGADRSGSPRDRFDMHYLCIEDAFADVESELPLIPSTLDDRERQVLLLTFLDFKPAEIAMQIGATRKEVWATMALIREKMADWAPSSAERAPLAA